MIFSVTCNNISIVHYCNGLKSCACIHIYIYKLNRHTFNETKRMDLPLSTQKQGFKVKCLESAFDSIYMYNSCVHENIRKYILVMILILI